MTKYREITNISRVTDMILICRKQRYLKRRSDTIPIISISAIYHGIFRYIDPPLMHWLTSIDGLNFIQIGPPAAKIWRLINFQDGSRGGALLLPVSYLMMLHSAKGQNLSANQISSTYLNSRLRCKYFRFGKKQTSAILEFYFRFRDVCDRQLRLSGGGHTAHSTARTRRQASDQLKLFLTNLGLS